MIKENQKLLNLIHLIIDALIIVASFIMAYYLRFNVKYSPLIKLHIIKEPFGYYFPMSKYMEMLLFLIPFYIIAYFFFHLYDPKRTSRRVTTLWALIKANAVGIVYCTTVLYFMNATYYARLFLGIFFFLNTICDFWFRYIVTKILKKMRRRGKNLKHVLLVGYGRAADAYIDRMLTHNDWGYYIHGVLDDNRAIGTKYRGVEVIGTIDSLPELLATNEYDEIVITLNIEEYSKLENIVVITEKYGVHTKFVPDYNNIIPTKPYTEDLDGLPVNPRA